MSYTDNIYLKLKFTVVIYRIHYLGSGQNRIRIFFQIQIRPDPDPSKKWPEPDPDPKYFKFKNFFNIIIFNYYNTIN